ncbi:hypothetical protein CC86DRAFT_140504 [Ophiobolus disseminans]|uniref:Uncharacterized protein n=1 Tax=Ophiobolus disseminans TaxID=1469910 RepID=A0A6A7AEE7_9PLEO|nr:hypothetical protein CC86DRAFT_140504 [Ophiobolus disseminans]
MLKFTMWAQSSRVQRFVVPPVQHDSVSRLPRRLTVLRRCLFQCWSLCAHAEESEANSATEHTPRAYKADTTATASHTGAHRLVRPFSKG